MDNTVTGVNGAYGGGMEVINCNGKIIDNVISNNTCVCTAAQANSAGIGLWSDLPGRPMAVIEDNQISNNSASGVDAGGLPGAASGGLGIFHYNAIIRNNEIIHNVLNGTLYTSGAGLHCEDAEDITLIDGNYIANNTGGQGTGRGGGIHIYNGSPAITNNIIFRNSATYGGGISIRSNSNTNIFNNTFTSNSATYGGGVCSINSYGIFISL